MSTLTFDTLKFANRLKTAGVPAVQAEAEADALAEVLETNLGELATKSDLREVETGLRHEIGDVRHEISDLRKDMDAKFAGVDAKLEKTESAFRQEMTNLKFELLKWMIGLLVAQTTLLLALLKFFPINS
jgi:coiled-coil family 90 protein